MEQARELARYVSLATGVVCLWQRNRILDFTCTGVFFASQVFFVLIGVLAAPWLIDSFLPASYPYIRWVEIDGADLQRTIVITAGGTGLALLGNVLADGIAALLGRRRPPWAHLLRTPRMIGAGFSDTTLTLLCFGCAALASLALGTRWSVLVEGLNAGYVLGNVTEQFEAREAMQSLGYGYYMMIFNVMPFLSVLSWMSWRLNRRSRFRAIAIVGLSSFFLLATFEKRPFVVFLLMLALAHLMSEVYTGRLRFPLPRRLPVLPGPWLVRFPWLRLAFAIGLAFGVLMVLYYLSTDIGAESDSAFALLGSVAVVTWSRVLGRLAVMPILYAAYFPSIEPHYGFTNIGKLSDLLGTLYYPDTVNVLSHFTDLQSGGGAIGAVVDLYAAFGWSGWALGCITLGASLRALDYCLLSLEPTILNRALTLFALVFSFYLSQASVARCLSTYGGGTYVALYLALVLGRAPLAVRRAPFSKAPKARPDDLKP